MHEGQKCQFIIWENNLFAAADDIQQYTYLKVQKLLKYMYYKVYIRFPGVSRVSALPAVEYWPGLQSVLPLPSLTGQILPAGHVVHVLLPPREYVPGEQSSSKATL